MDRSWDGATRLGMLVILLVVAHVYREDELGEEIIRVISAREAEKRDIRRYQAQAVDES